MEFKVERWTMEKVLKFKSIKNIRKKPLRKGVWRKLLI